MENQRQIRQRTLYACFISFLSLGFVSVAQADKEPKELIITQEREVKDFDKVSITGSAKVAIQVGKPYSLTLKGPKENLDGLTTKVDQDTLVIESKLSEIGHGKSITCMQGKCVTGDNISCHGNICTVCTAGTCKTVDLEKEGTQLPTSSYQPIEITLSVPALTQISIHGSAKATVVNIEDPSFTIDVSGSGSVTASGHTKSLDANLSGSGKIDTTALLADSATAQVTGSGSLRVHAHNTLTAQVLGSGRIYYTGNPQIFKQVLGSGKISELP